MPAQADLLAKPTYAMVLKGDPRTPAATFKAMANGGQLTIAKDHLLAKTVAYGQHAFVGVTRLMLMLHDLVAAGLDSTRVAANNFKEAYVTMGERFAAAAANMSADKLTFVAEDIKNLF